MSAPAFTGLAAEPPGLFSSTVWLGMFSKLLF